MTIDAASAARDAFVICISRALRVVQLHRINNDAVGPIVSEAVLAAQQLAERGGGASIQVSDESLFCNRQHVKPRGAVADAVPALVRIFERLRATELVLAGTVDQAGLTAFLMAFQQAQEPASPSLVGRTVGGVTLRFDAALQASLAVDPRMRLVRAYAQLLLVVQDACERVRSGEPLLRARLRRALQAVADASQGHESLLLGLTRFSPSATREGPRLSLAHQLVAVAACCLAMCRKLQLNRPDTMTVCVAALEHDFGRVFDDDSTVFDARRATLQLLELYARTDAAAATEAMVIAIEVAALRTSTSTGLPPGAAAALVAVASTFTSLVAGTSNTLPVSPDRAVRLLRDGQAGRHDDVVVRLFIAAVGVYPVGTWVRLSAGQLAIVVSVPFDPAQFAKPIVKVVQHQGQAADALVDLAQRDDGLRIVDVVEAPNDTVNLVSYLLS